MQELLARILKEQDTFPAAQKQVAAYVVDNYFQIPFLSITALARNIGVSDTTIIKFCNQLGFDGFGEFKKIFSDYVHSELVMYNKLSSSSAGDAQTVRSPFQQVLDEDIANIQSTLANPINQENMPKLMDMIQKANGIYAVGGRASAVLANYLASTLRYLGLQVHTLSGGVGDQLDQMFTIQKTDLVIALCFPRYTSFMIDGLKELHERNVPIVLITDTGLSPAYPYADLVFHCAVSTDGYFPCYASCLSLLSVICRSAGIHLKEKATDHIHMLEKSLLDYGIFL